jgi:hypothetical protein
MSTSRDIDIETFAFGNTRSIRALTPNGPGEEISPMSYLRFIQHYVRKMGGVVEQADLEAEIEKHFGGIWGPDDLRPLRIGGRYPRPKWKNSLDWAKVMARKEDPPILARTTRRKGRRFTVLVLITNDTDPEWVEWVQHKTKNKFRKKCDRCYRWVSLSAEACGFCGNEFPAPSERKHKLPREKK